MRKYDEPDPWKLADAMGIIVQVMPLGSTDKSCKGFFCDNQGKSTSPSTATCQSRFNGLS